ncbi:MAG: UPF0158 family protein [Acidobacteriota bacterium]|nr:UPF0158 family protein [Acidobacteriota bacterium]MDH3785538.1 UPF0158 family protein [Acidobacteriota bacterium]
MKHKPIKVDWGELEIAFNNQNEELVYCLDLVTGYVTLEGEGEDSESDQDDAHFDAHAVFSKPLDDSTLRPRIHCLAVDTKLRWMIRFINEAEDADAGDRKLLKEALEADDAPAELKRVLNEHTETRDAWFLFRAERGRDAIERWLVKKGVTPIEPPPWRST